MACETFEDVVEILKRAKLELSDILQACEHMDRASWNCSINQLKKEDVFDTLYPHYYIIEVASNNDPEENPQDYERLLEFIDSVSDKIHDGVVSQGEAQLEHIWYLREMVGAAFTDYGYMLTWDVSLKNLDFYRIVEETRTVIANSPNFT